MSHTEPLTAPVSWPPPDAPDDAPPSYWRTMTALWIRKQQAELRANRAPKAK